MPPALGAAARGEGGSVRARTLAPLVAFAGIAGALTSCRGRATGAECAAAADRYVDLAAREAPGAAAMTPAQLAAVRDVERGLKRAEPAFRRVQDHCQDVAKAETSCALDAKTTKDWEACFASGDR
jgi:hypothetical protein